MEISLTFFINCDKIIQILKGDIMIRNATMKDAESILKLVNENASKGLMLSKSPYAVYKDIQAYVVYEENGKILGCARLNIAWNDLAEIASLAVDMNERGKGIGKKLVLHLVDRAKYLDIKRVFTLTYQVPFFIKCGFHEVERQALSYKVFGDCLSCPKVNNCDEHALIMDI